MNAKEYLSQLKQGYALYKLLHAKYTNKGFTYKEGLNEDIHPFDPSGKCRPGGLYFFDNDQLLNYCNFFNKPVYIAEVTLHEDAFVYTEVGKQKANKLTLHNIQLWSDFLTNNQDICKSIVIENGRDLEFMKKQTDELSKFAVQKNGLALEYVKDKTDELCELAVQQNGMALEFVNEPTYTLCELAVQKNGLALQYVKEQTDELCKLAIQQNGMSLKFVKEQTDELCKLAVQQNGYSLKYVKEQTDELCKLALQKNC
jgi:hypothetical protein